VLRLTQEKVGIIYIIWHYNGPQTTTSQTVAH
jgi:hypothetical protein